MIPSGWAIQAYETYRRTRLRPLFINKDSDGSMMATTDHSFEELAEIVGRIAAEYGMLKVYLFGSRARGDNGPDSDYDFCVTTGEDCTLFTLSGFFSDLKDALGTEIDVVCEEVLDDDFLAEIDRDGILLYTK